MNVNSIFGLILLSPLFCSSQILQSPRITNWGDWGSWELCGNGELAIGMKLKTQEIEAGIVDNTALNGVGLLCGHKHNRSGGSRFVYSKVGEWGTWGALYNCPSGKYITGFQLRTMSWAGAGEGWSRDDTSSGNLRIFCGPGDETFLDGDGYNGRASWSSRQDCPPPQGVCGLKTQIEPPQGSGDDSSLNNIDMYCC